MPKAGLKDLNYTGSATCRGKPPPPPCAHGNIHSPQCSLGPRMASCPVFNDAPRAGSGVKKRTQEVVPGYTAADENRGPAQAGSTRGGVGGRESGTISVHRNPGHTRLGNRWTELKHETRSGMELANIAKVRKESETGGGSFHALGQWRLVVCGHELIFGSGVKSEAAGHIAQPPPWQAPGTPVYPPRPAPRRAWRCP